MAEAARLELEAAMAKAAENAVDDAARSWIRDVCIRAAAEDRRCPGALPELLKSLAAVFVAVTTQRQEQDAAEAAAAEATKTPPAAEDPWRSMACLCPCGSRLFLSEGDCLLCDGGGVISRQLMDAYLASPAARNGDAAAPGRDVDESYEAACPACGAFMSRRDLATHRCAAGTVPLPLISAPDGARRLSEVRLRRTVVDEVHEDKWAVPRRVAAARGDASPTGVEAHSPPKPPKAKPRRRGGKHHKRREAAKT